ncbi:MAG TPA: trigger factor [Gammaproteobacteria bacterium]|nr:trigger factor [Gammaproteobacteria bacterium]
MNATNSNSYEVSLETSAGLERRLTVRVPNAEIERAIAARLAQVGKTAKLKGFRPGKVPQKVVRQYYGGQVRDEVMTDVIRTTYSRAIEEKKLNPAGGPRIEPLAGPEAAAAEHFTYRATFEVYPEFTLKDLAELAIDVPSVDIEEPDLDAMIEKLRGQRATWAVVERSAAEGDRVTVDFTGTIDGEAFEGGEGKGIGIVVGSGQVLKDFDAALRGSKAGDSTTATVPFPQDYPAKNLAGKTAQFAIDLKKVEERRLPELDDAFADSFGLAGGAGALRGEVRNNMQRELKERLRAETKARTFDALIGANRIVLPRALVEQEINALQADALRQMGSSDPKDAPARERFENAAQRRVTIGLLIQELLREHKIKLDQPRVEQRIKELAAPYEKPDEAAQFYRSDRGMMAQVEASVLEDQVVDFLQSRARCTTKNISFKDFMGA